MCKRLVFSLILLSAFHAGSARALAAAEISAQLVASGFKQPTFLCAAPGDTSRLFVLERQSGKVRVIKNGVTLNKPFLNVKKKLGSDAFGGEKGLLGLAFPPDFGAENRFFYVSYTDLGGATVVEAYKARKNPDRARQRSGKVILRIEQPDTIHYSGMLAFGPDGYLYVGRGDGGPQGDPLNHAQSLDTLLGKILRISVHKDKPYTIPASNPFVGVSGAMPEIWAYGLRNPWRFSFDRQTGDLYIGDVGQNSVEEVDFQPASSSGGENYGWNIAEGNDCFQLGGTCGSNPGLTPPIHTYSHGVGTAVIGGYVYRGSAIPSLQGTYFLADFEISTILSFKYDGHSLTNYADRTNELEPVGSRTINLISSFGEDAAGELYIVDIYDGEIYKIVPR